MNWCPHCTGDQSNGHTATCPKFSALAAQCPCGRNVSCNLDDCLLGPKPLTAKESLWMEDVKEGLKLTASQWRKERPLCRGVLDYFPDALMEVAYCSYIGTSQHHPDKEMHWDKEKSTDEADCVLRHLKDRGKLDTDGVRHSAKVAWRALAMLQREIEAERKK